MLLSALACGDDGGGNGRVDGDGDERGDGDHTGDGDEGGDGDGDATWVPPGPVTKDNAFSELAKAVCDGWFDCPCDERQASWGDKDTCREVMVGRWEADLQGLDGFEIDTDCVDRQLLAMHEIGCKAQEALYETEALITAYGAIEYCHAITRGKGVGEDCEFHDTSHLSADECEGGLFCDNGSCTKPPAGPGESCANGELCQNTLACVDTVCSKVEVEPSACDCDEDEYCYYDDPEAPPKCAALIPAGESCAGFKTCVADATCDRVTEACLAMPQAGEQCRPGSSYERRCATGLWCVDDVCEPLPGEGEPCVGTTTWDYKECQDGLRCSYFGSGRTCVVPQVEGGLCGDDAACEETLRCNDGTCGPPEPWACN
jgi:hypothetical protein